MPGPQCKAVLSVEGREVERTLLIVPEDELNGIIA